MVPSPTAARLARLTVILDKLTRGENERISSTQLAKLSGFQVHTIRKDINCLGNPGENGAGYDPKQLLDFIKKELNLIQPARTGIAGLGKLGSSILFYPKFIGQGIDILAGFDSSINRIEQLPNEIPLFPSYEIAETTAKLKLELGVIAVPAEAAQKTAERMVNGGIKGVLNFSPTTLNLPEEIEVKNFYVAEELMVLAAKIRQKKGEKNV